MQTEMSISSYLQTLIGKAIKVHKDTGVEQNGRLLGVKSNYLILQNDQVGVTYHHLRHVKGFSEDWNNNNMTAFTAYEHSPNADDFTELLTTMKYKVICIDCGDANTHTGQVIAVNADHLVLKTEQGHILYFETQMIKGFYEMANKPLTFYTENAVHYEANDYNTLLDKFRFRWVCINSGDGQTVEGLLVKNLEDEVHIVLNNKAYRLSKADIRNISIGKKDQQNNQQNNENKDQNKDQNKNENKDQKADANKNEKNDKHEKEHRRSEPESRHDRDHDRDRDRDRDREHGSDRESDRHHSNSSSRSDKKMRPQEVLYEFDDEEQGHEDLFLKLHHGNKSADRKTRSNSRSASSMPTGSRTRLSHSSKSKSSRKRA